MSAVNQHFLEVMAARLQGVRRDRRTVVPAAPPPSSPQELPKYYTWEEAAAIARVSVKTLRRWGIPRSKPAGRVLIKRIEFEKFLEQARVGGDDSTSR